MSDKKKPHESMDANAFLAHVRGHHDDSSTYYVENPVKRAETMHELLSWYFRPSVQGKFHEEIIRPFNDLDLKKYASVHKRIEEAYKDRVSRGGKRLTKHQADDLLRDLVDELLPDAKVGVKGNKEHNYSSFQHMLKSLKDYVGEDEANTLVKNLYSALQEGKGYEASHAVVQILKKYHHAEYTNNLVVALTNPHDKEFAGTYASHLEKLVTNETGRSVVKEQVAEEIVKAAQLAARGDYAGMLREYEPEVKAKPKHKAKH